MADFISIDWEDQELCVLDASVAHARVHVRHAFRLAWPRDPKRPAENQQLGDWLKSELSERGIRSRQVLVVLPRDEVVVRQLDVPDVADQQLPDLVRLQAETKSSSSLEQLALDFLPLPRAAKTATRQVLMATFAREKLDEIREIVEAAGLALASVGISPVAVAELVARAERRSGADTDETTLLVVRQERRLEISLMRKHHLLFMHSTQLIGDSDAGDSQLALAEIRRSLGSVARIDAEIAVARAWLVGKPDANQTLYEMLTDHLSCDVARVDPTQSVTVSSESSLEIGQNTSYAGPVGMLLATGEPMVSAVDFLAPRRAAVRPDRRKVKAALATVALLASIFAVYGLTRWQVHGFEKEIARKQKDLALMVESVESGKSVLAVAGVVDEWQKHNVDWLHHVSQLNQLLPGSDRLYLTDFRCRPLSGKSVAQIEATGFARSRRDVEELYQRLAERNYRVRPHEISHTARDTEYPYEFRLDMAILPSVVETRGSRNPPANVALLK